MSTITVTGTARAAVTPDRALVRIALTHLAPTASAAMTEISRRGEALAVLLAELGVARADWATSGVNVAEESEWRNDRSVVVGQRATASASITVRDIAADYDVLAGLLRDVVDTVGGRIDSMSWVVDDDNPARLELLAAAAQDARVRADTYAGALGLVVSGVDAVSEHPLSNPEPRAEGAAVMGRAMMSDVAPLPINAGDVDLTARVNVRFTVLAA
jgi:uncharacterized protein YggE